MGYEARVFSVIRCESRSAAPVAGSTSTFSEHGAEHFRGGKDLGLALTRQPDHFRVAAALEVENALVDHPCSSSPINRRRVGGERRLPVPERPKNSAQSPCLPTLAEQCIESTPCSGSR